MSNFYYKYTNAINDYNKPGIAKVESKSKIDYYTDDEKKRPSFKPLISNEEYENKYGFMRMHNEAPGPTIDDYPLQYQQNKQVREVYPSSSKYYNPYGTMNVKKSTYEPPSYDERPTIDAYETEEPGYRLVPQPAYYEHPAYAVPKYVPVYEVPRQFFSGDIYKPTLPNARDKLKQAQTDYYAKKRPIPNGTTYSDRTLNDDHENLNSRQLDRRGKFEDFMKYTAPRLQYKKIVLIQALFRGAYVRKRRFPQIKQFHAASVRVVDSMIDHYIEDVYIPDLLLELLAKNKVYENFDLYSDENKILYEVRASYMDNVIKDMVKEIVKDTTDRIVNRYLNKRYRDKDADERDPLSMVLNGMMNKVMKEQAEQIAKETVHELSLDYLIQSQFYSLLNRVWIPNQVERVIVDSVEDIAIENVINTTLDDLLRQEVPRIWDEAIETEKIKQENEFLDHAFNEYLNRWMLESWVDNFSKLYEEEESKIHVKEQQEKAIRDHAKKRTDLAKQEYRDLTNELESEKLQKSTQAQNFNNNQPASLPAGIAQASPATKPKK